MPMIRMFLGGAAAIAILASAPAAFANCSIHNDTGWSFTVESKDSTGSVSGQRVDSHSQTSVHDGRLIGTSKEGKTISGSCRNGDRLEISDDHGVPVLMSK